MLGLWFYRSWSLAVHRPLPYPIPNVRAKHLRLGLQIRWDLGDTCLTQGMMIDMGKCCRPYGRYIHDTDIDKFRH